MSRAVYAGALLMASGLATLAVANDVVAPNSQTFLMAGAMAVCGFGQGLIVGPLVSEVLAVVPARHAGAGSGVLNTTTQASMALGVAGKGLINRMTGFTTTSLLLAVIALLVAVLYGPLMPVTPRANAPASARDGG